MKCKEKATNLVFDATLYGEDAVMVRRSSPEPVAFYIISLDLFVDKFEELYIPEH